MPEIPNTRFVNLVDTPAALQYSQSGEAPVQLDPQTGGILDVTGFRQISIRIGPTSASTCEMFVGKISGTTLAMRQVWAIDNQIHAFPVTGPELALFLKGGQPGSSEKVQLWVYLRS